MGGECQCCGYNKLNSALELHHLVSQEKEFTIASNTNVAWDSVRKEIQKCILVCANCHREIHAGLINNETLKSSFIEEKAIEIDELITSIKQKEIFYCKNCGAEIYKGSQLCVKCFAEQRRRVERPTRLELKNLIRTMPFTKIGEKYSVADNTIRKWCAAENLPTKKNQINNYTNEEWELI